MKIVADSKQDTSSFAGEPTKAEDEGFVLFFCSLIY